MVKRRIKFFIDDEDGATSLEYGIMAGLVSLFVFAAVDMVSEELLALLDIVEAAITNAGAP